MFTAIVSFIQKLRAMRPIYAQVLLVAVAFMLMTIISYFFMSNTEHRHQVNNAYYALDFTAARIEADLSEPGTVFDSVALTVRSMILRGADSDEISEYIIDISNILRKDDRRKLGLNGVYGLYDVFEDLFINDGEWTMPPDYVLRERPWYKAAIEAEGELTAVQYMDARTGGSIITYTRRIFDDEGRPLAVLGLDMPLDKIGEYVVKMDDDKNGNGVLLNERLEFIAHPDPDYLGKHLRDVKSGISKLSVDVSTKREISEHALKNHRGEASVAFFRYLDNGWSLGIIMPRKNYLEGVTKLAVVLGILGVIMASALIAILVNLDIARNKSNIESQHKSGFLATMSHEIRTPMNAILGITEIQMEKDSLPRDTIEALGKIYNSGHLLIGILNDILDISKIEAGKLELVPVKYEVASLLQDTVMLNMTRIASKPIVFELQVDPQIPMELFGDELRIKQILNNLLSNAFKYTDKGKVVLSVTAQTMHKVKYPYVLLVFSVSDTGQGMTDEQVAGLFNEYTRFNIKANRATEGTGLGLNITRRLAHMMNGEITVKSEQGKGSVFTVNLPQGSVTANILGAEAAENLQQFRTNGTLQTRKAQIVREYMPYGSVLVVDDVETNLYVAQGLLSPYGLAIDTAESGIEAVEKIKAGNIYDIVYMDHMMPKMDGVEATKIMRSMGYTHPIVALTANAVTGQAEMFLANGFDGFISKPIDIRQLNDSLNRLIRNKQPPEVIKAVRQNMSEKPASGTAAVPQTAINHELARIFVRDAAKAADELESIYQKHDAFEDEDIQMYIINAHGIKSALANIGESSLSGLALRLENAGRAGETAVIIAETPAFLASLRETIEKISPKENHGGDGIT